MNIDIDDADDSSAAAAAAIVAEADRTAAAPTAGAADAADATPVSFIITTQDLPPLPKILTALQDAGVPKMSQEGIRTTKYEDLERMLIPIAKKILEKKLPYIGKNQTRIKQGLLADVLAARTKQPKTQVAPQLTSALPATHQQSYMYIIDNDDVDTAGLLGVVLNFLIVKKASGNSGSNNNSMTQTVASRVAAAAASAAARRKKRDKIEGLAAAGADVAAVVITKPRKRGAAFFNVTKSLTLAIADEICNLAVEACTIHGFNPICICVMDPAGHTIVTKRMDGCPPMVYPKLSHAKANTCVSTKASSRAYGAKYLQRPYSNDNDDTDDHDGGGEVGPSTFTRVINQISIAGGDLAAFQGGILVKEKSTGVIVGSVGVSGAAGDEDEFCALEGVHGCSMARELTTVPEQHCCSTIRMPG